jgi:hypothetical protein
MSKAEGGRLFHVERGGHWGCFLDDENVLIRESGRIEDEKENEHEEDGSPHETGLDSSLFALRSLLLIAACLWHPSR